MADRRPIVLIGGIPAELPMGDYALGTIRGIGSFCAGKPTANEEILGAKSQYAFTISTTASTANASVAFTAQTIFDVKKNGTKVGEIRFNASATAGIFQNFTDTAVAVGSRITVQGGATPDSTGAGIDILLREA